MIGTCLNAGAILVGGVIGLVRQRRLPPASEGWFKIALGAFTAFYGLRLVWLSLNGTFFQLLKQLFVAVLAMVLGRLCGRLLGLQRRSNALGRAAREAISSARPHDPLRFSAGFKACAALFCAAPLGLIGSVQDGLSGYFYPLAVKAVMDGLASLSFVSMFGRSVLLSALPVFALQGSITLVTRLYLSPFLEAHGLVDSVNATGGLMVASVALVILGLKKIELADYLPSLFAAPILSWLLR